MSRSMRSLQHGYIKGYIIGLAVILALFIPIIYPSSVYSEDLKSGPQIGEGPISFSPININGPEAGKANCLV